MSTIDVGGLGIHHEKTFEAAIAEKAHDGDTIKIHKTINLANGVMLRRSLYIEGTTDNTIINVPENKAGLLLDGNIDVHLKNLTFNLVNQSNAIGLQPNFDGALYLNNVKILYDSKIIERELLPGLIGNYHTNDAGKSHLPSSNVFINDCTIEQMTLPCGSIDIKDSTIGREFGKLSILQSEDIRISNSHLDNMSIFNMSHGIEHAVITDVESFGRFNLFGDFKVDSVQFLAMSDLLKRSELLKQYKRYLKNFSQPIKQWYLMSSHSTDYGSSVNISNVSFNKQLLDHSLDQFYKVGFVENDQATLVLDSFSIPLMSFVNSTQGGTLTMNNVQDKSEWKIKNTTLSNRNSSSSLFGDDSTNQSEDTLDSKKHAYGALKTLDGLTGLKNVKEQIHKTVDLATMNIERQKRGLSVNEAASLHAVFAGSAGTGKTTVARLYGQALYENGVLKTGKFVEASSKDLVAGYVGQTAPKTHKVIESALDGVLFIDEAYSLAPTDGGNSFNDEAVDQLIADMENYRDRLVVIMAGYTDDMRHFFQVGNQGLKSRFVNWITFDDYSVKELVQILLYQLNNQHLVMKDRSTSDALVKAVVDLCKVQDKNSGNGRFIRNFVQELMLASSARLSSVDKSQLSNRDLMTITAQDAIDAENKMIDKENTLKG